MTDPPNYVRDALLVMDANQRRGLRNAALTRANTDHHGPMSSLWVAIWQQVADLDDDEKRLLHQLETPDPIDPEEPW